MPNNIAASMTASIVIDKSDLLAQILKGLSEGQKELENNKLEMYFDFSDSKNKAEFEKTLQKYKKQLASGDFVVKITNEGIEETVKSLDKLLDVIKSIASGKGFGTGNGNGNGIGNSIVDENQLKTVIDLFTKMESSLASIKKIFVDVGDGEEFSPLFSMINKINSSISELSSSVKSIGLNMNIDVGSDTELEAKIQSKMSNALQAYQRLFEHIKMSGVGGSMVNTNFFEFDINQFDTMMAKIQAYRKFIENMRNQVKSEFGGKDLLYTETDKKYWTSAASAMGQLTKAQNEMNKSADANPLDDLFGKTDLTGVIEQLNLIVSKLDEISVAATKFSETFSQGLNVTTSVEEVTKLTEKVKELEAELAKVKSVSTGSTETNISSGKKPGKKSDKDSSDDSINSKYRKALDKKFALQNLLGVAQRVGDKENIDNISKDLDKVLSEIVELEKQGAKLEKIEFVPNTSGFDEVIAKFDILKDKIDAIVKITKTTQQTADGMVTSYHAKLKNGDSLYVGEDSKPQVLKATETVYDASVISKAYDEATKFNNALNNTNALLNKIEVPNGFDEKFQGIRNTVQSLNSDLTGVKITLSEYSKEITSTVKDFNDSIKSRESSINSIQSFLDTYNRKLANLSATPADFNQSEKYKANLKELKEQISQFEAFRDQIGSKDTITEENLQSIAKYKSNIEEATRAITSMTAAEKGSTSLSRDKLYNKIGDYMKKNSGLSKQFRVELQKLQKQLTMRGANANVSDLTDEFLKLQIRIREAGEEGKKFWDVVKEKAWYGAASQIGMAFGVNDIFRYIGEGVNIIRDLDEAMTEVRKVSDATEASYARFQKTVASTAKEIASTNKEFLNSSADFLRLGYSLEQAEDLAKNATLFVNVGDGVDVQEATEDMITAMKAFDIQAEDSIKIVDDYNQIGNMYALSATDIGEAMKRSASALEVGNNSFEESIGLITAMNEIVQNSENTGNSLKVLSLRLRGAKAELESMGEDTDGVCESTSKLREQIKALSGVDIMLDDNTFKSTAQQVKELGAVFENLSDTSQAALLEIIAGKSRSNNIAALLKNYKQIDNVVNDLSDAEGSALRENEAIVDSINGRIKILSATAEEFWQTIIDKDAVKNTVTLATNLLDILTKIVDKIGLIPTLATGIGAALSFKNVGILELY